MSFTQKTNTRKQQISLDSATTHILEECRMVLPGIQALFGFQLIAVFNQGFNEHLSSAEQQLHLIATVLVTVAIALVMAPAALHRQTEPCAVSNRFIELSSKLLLWSMFPLAVGICLEIYLLARIILINEVVSTTLAVALFILFVNLWIVLPLWEKNKEE